jgi:hypothetical protein
MLPPQGSFVWSRFITWQSAVRIVRELGAGGGRATTTRTGGTKS